MPRRRIERPRALLDLSAADFSVFKNDREGFLQEHPELGDLLKRAGNEYLAIGWRMRFDGQSTTRVLVRPRRTRKP